MWSSFAWLTRIVGPIPPFEFVALTFGLAGGGSLLFWALRGEDIRAHLSHPPHIWALGLFGLFGYHCLYFLALGIAPVVEASLVNYLWPLLIVVFAGFLPGAHLSLWPLLGAAIGLMGAVILLTDGFSHAIGAGSPLGYGAAFAAAIVWAGYSVLSRRFGAVPTQSIGGFCLVTALLALACHLGFESWVPPRQLMGWLALLAMGIGPTGLAFFAWDYGVKRGNITVLGGMSYATPLLSTGLLIATGEAAATPAVLIACLAIVGGALLAARDLWVKAPV